MGADRKKGKAEVVQLTDNVTGRIEFRLRVDGVLWGFFPSTAEALAWHAGGNLLLHNKSYSGGPIAGHREVCDHNQHDAAFPANEDSPFGTPPGLNPHRLSQAVG